MAVKKAATKKAENKIEDKIESKIESMIENNIEKKSKKKTEKKTEKKTAQKNLIILESPHKIKTLKKFMGSNYMVAATVGHVRDLPKSEMGVDIENDFEPKYITIRGKGDLLAALRKQVKTAKIVYLATDPDREGEAISWHLMHSLKLDPEKTKRITFNEVTQTAVKKAIKEARDLDMALVDAQQARRILDRIVGYKISPLLWSKVKKGLSAGRVQSVTLKMICDREEEIENFNPVEYWTIDVTGITKKKEQISFKYAAESELKTEKDTEKIKKIIAKNKINITDIKLAQRTRKPQAPLTTSTLQQEASRHLGYSAQKTMSVAQQLYEGVDLKNGGTEALVSYIRTDSVRISQDAYNEAKAYIGDNYGEAYVPTTQNEYKSRARAQEAHEAIRPTDVTRTPAAMKPLLSAEQFKVYSLIWERFVASQMTPAVYDTKTIRGESGGIELKSVFSAVTFDGYKKIYKKDDEEEMEQKKNINAVVGDVLDIEEVICEQHFTQPPARFSEASVVKTLEENGVGRPSTYAPTISTLIARRYLLKENKVFYPTELGEIVNDITKNNFEEIADIEFTAKMEDELDKVEDGVVEWKKIIRDFYPSFNEKILEAEQKIENIIIKDEVTDVICENCGSNMVIKYGKFGKFLACPSYPDCKNTLPFHEEAGVNCPVCDGKVLIKKSKKGRKYYGCENNPTCNFISWSKPTGEKCPVCGEYLIIKGTKNPKVCCNVITCGYQRDLEPEEAAE